MRSIKRGCLGHVEVQCTAEALDQGDRAGLGHLVGMARFLDQMRGDDAVNDAQHLAHDLVVKNKGHRQYAEKVWKLPEGTIPGKPGYHAVLQNRMLKDGKLNAYWVMCNNNMQAGANMNEETLPGYRNPANFIVVSDPYPTVTAWPPT